MDIGQASNNDLQKAIDEITNGANNNNTVGELEAQIQSQMGVPPVPPVPGMPAPAVVPDLGVMPPSGDGVVPNPAVVEVGDQTAGVVEPTPQTEVPLETSQIVEEPVADTAQEEVAPVDTSVDLDSVKGAIVRELYPLLDMVEADPKDKFEVIKGMMEETGDKSMIVKGYDAAKGIADEKAKAEALLYLFENA